ncbi:MAG: dihydroorotate dehydrogenase [Actinomycetes bacterium]
MARGATSLGVTIGSLELDGVVMTASGTSGHSDELAAYGELNELAAVVVKSLSPDPWPGNPPPRLKPLDGGMLNSVGLQGPGLEEWLANDLGRLRATGATVVVSVWGHDLSEYQRAGEMLQGADIDAIEINVSCPNLKDHSRLFAYSPAATAAAVEALGTQHPRWAKLSPNTPDIADVARAAVDAGAEALTVANTALGMAIDIERRTLALGGGGGGLSGPAIHAIAVRAVFVCHQALPEVAIIGVGGISSGEDAIEMIMAGASAVQVGTAALAEPRAPWRVQNEVRRWLDRHDVKDITEIRGAVHG